MKTGDQIVQELPWKWRTQGTIFLIGGLGFMFDAWDVTLNGFLIPLVGAEWDLSPAARGWVGTSNLIGMAVGAVVWGAIADTIGRKRAFSLTLLMFSVFSLAGAASPDFVTFCVFRFLAGIGLGGCIPVDYALVGEFTPAKVRGKVLTAMDIWWPVGATLCGIISAALLAFDNWRLLLVVMVLPALLLFWVRRSVPESPMYLVRQGRAEQARSVIDALVHRTGATVEPWTLPEPVQQPKMTASAFVRQARDLWRYSAAITSVSWALFLTVFLVYYGALTWLPSILVKQGYGNYAAFMVTTLMTAIGIVGVVVSAWLVDVIGRKWVIGLSGPLAALALVLFAVQLDIETAAKWWITAFGFLIELTIPALYAYVSELYPTRLRASGFGWASTVSRVGAGFVPVIFGSLLWPYLGLPLTFVVIGVLLVLASLWMAAAAPETRGRELDDIGAPSTRSEVH
ncbi:MFS transporter [Saccharopolyspora phatthalungensis]|uniref:Putative MFS transporter n=1 Tax=Saccharopolyspora phatthalungensis TaxID=664693 RepID=A0A840QGX6_9PSEU|nr:MFS transporter [Saccharopolyspora phatthalungensis]MBB5157795.1 putative MFS transporter [Saccharopolyspora phatthalungensis]